MNNSTMHVGKNEHYHKGFYLLDSESISKSIAGIINPKRNFEDKESAVTHHLKIDRSDLTYNPKSDDEEFVPGFKNSHEAKTREPNPEWEEERRQRQEYWAMVKYARSQLYDYYGTGGHFCPAMYTMLGEIKRWSPEQILSEASRNGLI